ncbi:hypothetical protein LVD15_04620 [Fulvivirga maritima]|uniref:hypothetical protein n=1 Tax=Fulvivirga maritima TaxID=2904247 RepID=UPI001F21EFC9|nr:hypothetical protein [Fulvivirga maritima]UII27712.1 hypothetical protein LVD15_04620 [Fulvivirga maritima]
MLSTKSRFLAESLHEVLYKEGSILDLLEVYSAVKNKKKLAKVYRYLLDEYDYLPNEIIGERYSLNELCAVAATEKYIREPNERNKKERDKFYKLVSYPIPA